MKKVLTTAILVFALSSIALADFGIGTTIEYNMGATWAPAKVLEKIPNGYKLLLMRPGFAPSEIYATEASVRGGNGAAAPAPAPVAQQTTQPQVAGIGQQVEYNMGATWAPATVLEKIPNGYKLLLKRPGFPPAEIYATEASVRTAGQAPVAPQTPPQTAQAQPQVQAPARPPVINDANAARMDNTNTQVDVPNARIIEAVMRSMWEHPADPGMDGATTLTFENIAIGATRPWTVLDGNQGTPGTTVWQAKVNWTHTTHYRSRNRVMIRDWTVSVFKNALGKWVVQSTASTPQSEKVREDPPDMP